MRILERNVYVGPSMYAHFPVIKVLLDLGPLEEWPSGRLGPAFVDALVAALPTLQEHGCSYREPGGLIRRMREDEGTWLGHVLEHVAIELQNIAGEDVSFGKTRSTDVPGVYTVVYEYAQRDEGIAAGELAIQLLCALLPQELRPAGIVPSDWNWEEKRDEYIRYAQRRALGPSTASLVKAADERNIPWLRLNEQSLDPARPRQVSTAHPGDRHGAHQPHRRRARAGQGRDQQNSRELRIAGAAAGIGTFGRSGGARGRGARLPGRDQALRRQSRPRNFHRTHRTRGSARRLRGRRAALGIGDRRDVPAGR